MVQQLLNIQYIEARKCSEKEQKTYHNFCLPSPYHRFHVHSRHSSSREYMPANSFQLSFDFLTKICNKNRGGKLTLWLDYMNNEKRKCKLGILPENIL
jgi:hypothetical protein